MNLEEKRKLVNELCDFRESAPSAVHLVWHHHYNMEPPFEPYEIGLEGYLDSIREMVVNVMENSTLDSIISLFQTEYPEDWRNNQFDPK